MNKPLWWCIFVFDTMIDFESGFSLWSTWLAQVIKAHVRKCVSRRSAPWSLGCFAGRRAASASLGRLRPLSAGWWGCWLGVRVALAGHRHARDLRARTSPPGVLADSPIHWFPSASDRPRAQCRPPSNYCSPLRSGSPGSDFFFSLPVGVSFVVPRARARALCYALMRDRCRTPNEEAPRLLSALRIGTVGWLRHCQWIPRKRMLRSSVPSSGSASLDDALSFGSNADRSFRYDQKFKKYSPQKLITGKV